MIMEHINELILKLKNGEITVASIGWKDFQYIIYYLLLNKYRDYFHGRKTEIVNHNIGPIDIVIEVSEEKSHIFNPEAERHYIECKHYNRSLELDKVAKAYCVAIKDHPRTLIIVSSSYLSPQAVEYAKHFFSTKPSDEKVQAIFKDIFFTRISLEELLDIKSPSNDDEFIKLNYWEILEIDPFSQKIMETSDQKETRGKRQLILLKKDLNYLLKIWLNSNIKNIENHKFYLISENYTPCNHLKSISVNSLESGEIVLTYSIDLSVFKRENPNSKIHIQITNGKTIESSPIPLPAMKVVDSTQLFNDFRHGETHDFIKSILREDSPHIIFIHGEGGIGKTYFCNKVCDHLKTNYKFQNFRISVSKETTEAMFFEMIWPIIFPNSDLRFRSEDQMAINLLEGYLHRILDRTEVENIEDIINSISTLQISNIEFETIIFLCAKLITSNPTSRTILLQNSQKLSPHLTKGLKLLIKNIYDMGGCNTWFFLEYRDTKDEHNEHWEEFVIELLQDLPSETKKCEIVPLSQEHIQNGLSYLFMGTDLTNLTKIFLKKTGGNPLFLDQLVRYFLSEGVIEKIYVDKLTFRLNVFDRPALKRELSKIPESIAKFLEQRIKNYFKTYKEKILKKKSISYLGIASIIIGQEIDEERIHKAMGWSMDEIEELRFALIQDGILSSSFTSNSPNFIHEMMKMAVLNITSSMRKEFHSFAKRLISILTNNSSEDAIIAGKTNFLLKQLKDAYEWYNHGLEIAKNIGIFAHQRICLEGLKNILKREKYLDQDGKIKLIQICNELGHVEYQSGSQLYGLKTLNEAIENLVAMENLSVEIERQKKYLTSVILHHILTIYVRLMWPKEFMERFTYALDAIFDVEDLLHILNRFILICSGSNLPDIGLESAKIAVKIVSSQNDPHTYSVLLSDIGRLYLQDVPKIALKLWNEGLSFARDLRQTTHSTLNMYVGTLYKDGNFYSNDEIKDLWDVINNEGVKNQIIRLETYKAIKAYRENDIDEAKHLFSKALENAILYNLGYLQLPNHNNLAVIALLQDNKELAYRHFEKAFSLFQRLADFTKKHKKEAKRILYLIENEVNKKEGFRAIKVEKTKIDLPNKKPSISGLYNILIYNFTKVADCFDKAKVRKLLNIVDVFKYQTDDLYLLSRSSHPLLTHWQGKKLILAIE